MKASKRISFFLVHSETGQRYPVVNDDVVIGRTSGDILFAEDMQLSNQHCRIVQTAQGLGIHDLGSANGTTVDGKRLDTDKVYAFKIGAIVQIGTQQFRLTDSGSAKRPERRKSRSRRKRKVKNTNRILQLITVAAAIAVLYLGTPVLLKEIRRPTSTPAPVLLESPYSMVERELRTVIDQYKQIGADTQEGRITDKEMTFKIRRQLLPAFKLLQAKLSAVVPGGEYEKRTLDLNRQICGALIGQLKAMADNSEFHNQGTADAVKTYSLELEKLSAQMQALKKQRQPAQFLR